MASFRGSIDEHFTTPTAPARVREMLLDTERWKRLQDELQTATELAPGKLEIVLKEHQHGPTRFQGRYTARWTAEGDTVIWRSVPSPTGNFEVSGSATVTQRGAGSAVLWRESVTADIPVNRLVAKVVAPIADRMMARGLRGYLDRLRADLDRG